MSKNLPLPPPWEWFKSPQTNQWYIVGPHATIIARANTQEEALEIAKGKPLFHYIASNHSAKNAL